jgi:hypothetical protein
MYRRGQARRWTISFPGGSVSGVPLAVAELGPGLWRWSSEDPAWTEGDDRSRDVGSVYLETPDALVLVDPLVPAGGPDAERFLRALDRDAERLGLPVVCLLTCASHERGAAELEQRYGATTWRPERGGPLPAGVEGVVVQGGGRVEALYFLREHAALVAGELLVGDGEGGVRAEPGRRAELAERLLPLPVELVLVSHGEPVLADGRCALERALRG